MHDASFDLQKTVYDILAAIDPPLVAGGIHAVAPQDQPLPYVEIGESSSTEFDVECRRGLDEFLTIHVWTKMGSYAEVKEIMANISLRLHQKTLIVPHRSTALATVINQRAFADSDEEALHGVLTLRVAHWSQLLVPGFPEPPEDPEPPGPPEFWFGRTADRVNMLLAAYSKWSVGPSTVNYVEVDAYRSVTDVKDWLPGAIGNEFFASNLANAAASFGGTTAAPDGGTAAKLVETLDDYIVYEPKPDAWNLTNYNNQWTDFWAAAVAVLPCWEGIGNPRYYTAGGVPGPELTPVNVPTWGTVTGEGSSLSMGAGTSAGTTPDWRIEPVAGVDIVPTGQCTILWVRRNKATEFFNQSGWGIATSGSAGGIRASSGRRWQFGAIASNTTSLFGPPHTGYWDEPAYTSYSAIEAQLPVEIWAYVAGPNGQAIYFRNGADAQGKLVGSSATPVSRTSTSGTFGINTGNGVFGSNGVDVLFLAILNAEWTAEQVLTWMQDPYAPIRQDGGNRTRHAGDRLVHFAMAGEFMAHYGIKWQLAVFAKAAERTRITLMAKLISTNYVGVQAVFDLASGQVAIPANAFMEGTGLPWIADSADIIDYGDGWYKCILKFSHPEQPSSTLRNHTEVRVILDNGSGPNPQSMRYKGDGTSGVYVWKACMLPVRAFDLNTLTFLDHFDDPNTLDKFNTVAPGFNWYVRRYAPAWGPNEWWNQPKPPDTQHIENSMYFQTAGDPIVDGSTLTMSVAYIGHMVAEDGWPVAAIGATWEEMQPLFVGVTFKPPALFSASIALDPFTWQSGDPRPAAWLAGLEGILTPRPGFEPPIAGDGFPPGIPNLELDWFEYWSPNHGWFHVWDYLDGTQNIALTTIPYATANVTIVGTTMTVSTINKAFTNLVGWHCFPGGAAPFVTACIILQQLSGTPGGVGTYEVSVSQTFGPANIVIRPDFSIQNLYETLWLPATDTERGIIASFFNGRPCSHYSYTLDQEYAPGKRFSAMDNQHAFMNIGGKTAAHDLVQVIQLSSAYRFDTG